QLVRVEHIIDALDCADTYIELLGLLSRDGVLDRAGMNLGCAVISTSALLSKGNRRPALESTPTMRACPACSMTSRRGLRPVLTHPRAPADKICGSKVALGRGRTKEGEERAALLGRRARKQSSNGVKSLSWLNKLA